MGHSFPNFNRRRCVSRAGALMKHQTTLKTQKAYITRRADPDNALWSQQEAEVIALEKGDKAEAARRRHAAIHLKAKQRKRQEVRPLPAAIINALGPRDAIANLLKSRELEERHGRTALHIRDYMVRRQVTMGGGGNLVYVEGGVKSDLIDRVAGLRRGAQALEAGEATLPSLEFAKPVTGLLCGFISMRQASGQLRGRTVRVEAQLRDALRNYLEAAEPFFGRIS